MIKNAIFCIEMNSIKKSARRIHLKPVEYKWVKNILNVAKYDYYVRRDIINNGELNNRTHNILSKNKSIDADGHSGFSFIWSVAVARDVLLTKSKLKSHEQGVGCYE